MGLLINKSKLPYVMNSNTLIKPVIQPGGVFEGDLYRNLPTEFFEPFNLDNFYNAPIVSFQRNFALGDLIMLVPVLRSFKEFYNVQKIQLFTVPNYVEVLRKLFSDIYFYPTEYINVIPMGILYDLNGVLERDHSTKNNENHLHRCMIYAKIMALPLEEIKMDWSINKKMSTSITIQTKRKIIGLQVRGSGVLKTLPYAVIKELALELAKEYHVVLIDHEPRFGFEGKEISNLCGKLSVPECIAMMKELDCCITMDSGVLWMAHIAPCPVLTLLGPTREHERVGLHPMYPDKAKSISISEMIGCTPCFETKVNCKGKINCMKNFDKVQLYDKIKENLKLILGEQSNG